MSQSISRGQSVRGGATHSLTFALAGGIVAGLAARWFKRPALRGIQHEPERGHFRMRMVCFLNGKVEAVFRRWL